MKDGGGKGKMSRTQVLSPKSNLRNHHFLPSEASSCRETGSSPEEMAAAPGGLFSLGSLCLRVIWYLVLSSNLSPELYLSRGCWGCGSKIAALDESCLHSHTTPTPPPSEASPVSGRVICRGQGTSGENPAEA